MPHEVLVGFIKSLHTVPVIIPVLSPNLSVTLHLPGTLLNQLIFWSKLNKITRQTSLWHIPLSVVQKIKCSRKALPSLYCHSCKRTRYPKLGAIGPSLHLVCALAKLKHIRTRSQATPPKSTQIYLGHMLQGESQMHSMRHSWPHFHDPNI